MKKQIVIKFCTGTLCHVMGGGELHLLKQKIPSQWQEYVRIEGLNCENYCKNKQFGQPPFATFNDDLISEASLELLLKMIEQELNTN